MAVPNGPVALARAGRHAADPDLAADRRAAAVAVADRAGAAGRAGRRDGPGRGPHNGYADPLAYHPPTALWALLLIVPVGLLAANLLAVWPGHRAAGLRSGQMLRTE
jgi:hypothetical protein